MKSFEYNGHEVFYDPFYEVQGEYLCPLHAEGKIVPQEKVEELVRGHYDADIQAEARKNNFTGYPVTPLRCTECDNLLWQENQAARLA